MLVTRDKMNLKLQKRYNMRQNLKDLQTNQDGKGGPKATWLSVRQPCHLLRHPPFATDIRNCGRETP